MNAKFLLFMAGEAGKRTDKKSTRRCTFIFIGLLFLIFYTFINIPLHTLLGKNKQRNSNHTKTKDVH